MKVQGIKMKYSSKKKKKKHKNIIKAIDFNIEATNEQLIAGRLSSNTQQTGEILVNGHKETLAFGTSV